MTVPVVLCNHMFAMCLLAPCLHFYMHDCVCVCAHVCVCVCVPVLTETERVGQKCDRSTAANIRKVENLLFA